MAKINRKPFFYDSQLKRAILQVLCCFSGYQVITGLQRDGRPRFFDVPVIFADYSRTAGYILQGASLNTVSSVPIISVDMVSLKQKDELRRAPQYSETIYWRERQTNDDGTLGSGPGDEVQGERYIPVPYEAKFKIAIWASNNDQAFQLVEQIGTEFNPELDLMLSNSPADWTFLTYIRFDGEFEKTRVGVDLGAGQEEKFQVWNAGFTTILQLSPPVKVLEAKTVQSIFANFLDLTTSPDFDSMASIDGFVIRATDADTTDTSEPGTPPPSDSPWSTDFSPDFG